MSFNPDELLTIGECQEIDQTLLPAQERFLIRVALYSLRYLQPIAAQVSVPVAELGQEAITAWVAQDASIVEAELNRPGFVEWYAQFLISALIQLNQAAHQAEVNTADLTLTQVIDWFTAQAQARLTPLN